MRDTLAPIGTKHFIFSLAKSYSCRLKRKVVVVSYSQDVASLDLFLHSRKTNTSPLNIGHPKRKLVFQLGVSPGKMLDPHPKKGTTSPRRTNGETTTPAGHTFQLFQTPAPIDMVNIPSNMLWIVTILTGDSRIVHQLYDQEDSAFRLYWIII